jgi:LPXTG-motif cell wall-anchored protein
MEIDKRTFLIIGSIIFGALMIGIGLYIVSVLQPAQTATPTPTGGITISVTPTNEPLIPTTNGGGLGPTNASAGSCGSTCSSDSECSPYKCSAGKCMHPYCLITGNSSVCDAAGCTPLIRAGEGPCNLPTGGCSGGETCGPDNVCTSKVATSRGTAKCSASGNDSCVRDEDCAVGFSCCNTGDGCDVKFKNKCVHKSCLTDPTICGFATQCNPLIDCNRTDSVNNYCNKGHGGCFNSTGGGSYCASNGKCICGAPGTGGGTTVLPKTGLETDLIFYITGAFLTALGLFVFFRYRFNNKG